MHFHGAYFSNYSAWLKDPKHCIPSAQLVWSIIGQDILLKDIGGYFQGIDIRSGISLYFKYAQIHLLVVYS